MKGEKYEHEIRNNGGVTDENSGSDQKASGE